MKTSHTLIGPNTRCLAGLSAAIAQLVVALLSVPAPSLALETRTPKEGDNQVTVSADETIDDTLLAAGDTVIIDGVVTGNLIALARQVIVNGTVQGDVLSCSQNIALDGAVGGNALACARRIQVRGTVSRSLHGFAETIQIDQVGAVDADAIVFGAEVNAGGRVGRDLIAFAGTTDVSGVIARNLTARTGRLLLLSSTEVGGDLQARVAQAENVQIEPGARIGGRQQTQLTEKTVPKSSRFAQPAFYLWLGFRLAAAFLTGLVLFALFPAMFPERLGAPLRTLRTTGIGVLVLLAVPVAAVIAAVTLIGLPLALLTLGAWLAALYVASILASAAIGRSLLKTPRENKRLVVFALLLGLIVVLLATSVPYLGLPIRFLVVMLGFGLLASQLFRRYQQPEPTAR